MGTHAAAHPHDDARPLVFLDTNVILSYLRGEPAAAQLFSAEAAGQIRLAVNGIVLQELLLSGELANKPESHRVLDLDVLPIDYEKVHSLIPRARTLRDPSVHSNDVLIVSSADECDFLVTGDTGLKRLADAPGPAVVSPEEFVRQLRAA